MTRTVEDFYADPSQLDDAMFWELNEDSFGDGGFSDSELRREARRLFDDWMTRADSFVIEVFCGKLRYAEMKRRYKTEIDLCKAMIDGVTSIHVSLPIPATILVCYVVQHRYLDRLCGCPD